MNRDLLIQQLVALEAKLRRARHLAESVKDPVEFVARLRPIIHDAASGAQALAQRLTQREGR